MTEQGFISGHILSLRRLIMDVNSMNAKFKKFAGATATAFNRAVQVLYFFFMVGVI